MQHAENALKVMGTWVFLENLEKFHVILWKTPARNRATGKDLRDVLNPQILSQATRVVPVRL